MWVLIFVTFDKILVTSIPGVIKFSHKPDEQHCMMNSLHRKLYCSPYNYSDTGKNWSTWYCLFISIYWGAYATDADKDNRLGR